MRLILLGQTLFGLALTMQGCGRLDDAVARGGPGVGQVAPEIDGEDTDGIPFKLSEARGKVVLISFWAGWCPPCRALFPHERTVVEKYADRPFVMFGVNGDNSKEDAQAVIHQNGLTWRSWWTNSHNDIAGRWNLDGWPTLVVIDPKGVIRYRGRDTHLVDAMIERLVKQAEVGAGS